jgi:hypothetical protein
VVPLTKVLLLLLPLGKELEESSSSGASNEKSEYDIVARA